MKVKEYIPTPKHIKTREPSARIIDIFFSAHSSNTYLLVYTYCRIYVASSNTRKFIEMYNFLASVAYN